MSPVIRRVHCVGCGRPVHPDAKCEACGHTHGAARKTARRTWSGRSRKEWDHIAKAAIARDGRCRKCGSTDRLQGHHTVYGADATVDTVVTLCIHCHGSISGQKSARLAGY